MTKLEHEIKEFKDKNFPNYDKKRKKKKLCEEIGELGEALMRNNKQEICLELGDVGIVLAGLGICMNESLAAWMATAMDKNIQRIDNINQKD